MSSRSLVACALLVFAPALPTVAESPRTIRFTYEDVPADELARK